MLFRELRGHKIRAVARCVDIDWEMDATDPDSRPIRIDPRNPEDYYIIELLTPGRFCLLFGLGCIAAGFFAYNLFW